MRVQNYCDPLLDYLSNKYKITGNINKQKKSNILTTTIYYLNPKM